MRLRSQNDAQIILREQNRKSKKKRRLLGLSLLSCATACCVVERFDLTIMKAVLSLFFYKQTDSTFQNYHCYFISYSDLNIGLK